MLRHTILTNTMIQRLLRKIPIVGKKKELKVQLINMENTNFAHSWKWATSKGRLAKGLVGDVWENTCKGGALDIKQSRKVSWSTQRKVQG